MSSRSKVAFLSSEGFNTKADVARRLISITGVVQGVGFRPFVYRLAKDHGMAGWVRNTSSGVEVDVEGDASAVENFARGLRTEAPPLARIEAFREDEAPAVGYTGFEIRHSRAEEGRYQLISPDIATCADCLAELLDAEDRRYRYPFTNCTNCGPRFTIIEDIPYDRPKTTMKVFPMCAACQAEYDDPLDRRFHAQPNACPVCGPQLTLCKISGPGQAGNDVPCPTAFEVPDVIAAAAQALREGRILAIKGLGGFHLACDATNPKAVGELRRRKRRPHKPLAVMMTTMDEIRRHCRVGPEEEPLLNSPPCPIVLLEWRPGSSVCPEAAPGQRYLGVMLPYTPLHHLLLRETGRPLVMTSGNLSEEPIARQNEEALARLGPLADLFVLHNRDISTRYDDSVWFVPAGGPQPVRRSRGYAPFPVRLPRALPQVLACGAELKNTLCLTRDTYAFISQHIGDMENLETLEYYEETISLFCRHFRVAPEVVAYDLHPGYMATKHAMRLAGESGLPLIGVQHHHAHIAACLADNGFAADEGPVIGVALDGTGYGTDGHIWGCEFLTADYHGYRRAGHLEYLPLPGGEASIRKPYRLALAYSYALGAEFSGVPALAHVPREEILLIQRQIDRRLNTPLTSSCGRLFDAVAALCGVRGEVTYEAQGAMELEAAARKAVGRGVAPEGFYPFAVEPGEPKIIRVAGAWQALMEDLRAGVDVGIIGVRWHRTVARMVLDMCQSIRAETGLETVVLSGGCFQNRLLVALLLPLLEGEGFTVLTHHQVPCNDGGLSLGQAVVAGVRFGN